ncbi:MAG: type II/IV secretion system protein [Candidatus Desulforudis sp.]|nr:type II/IV secretion system protein [Desulforudis sp.]
MKHNGAPKRLLGDLLHENGLITEAQLEEALGVQRETGERLGRVLVSLGYVTERDIMEVLEFQLGIVQVDLANVSIDPLLLESVPEKFIRRHRAVPIRRDGNRLRVAMVDPLNVVAIDDLRLVTGCGIEPVLALEKDVESVIQKYFGLQDLEKVVQEMPEHDLTGPETVNLDPGEPLDDEAPVVRLAHSLIIQAVQENASDIHIEHREDQVRVRYRVDGLLREVTTLSRRFRSPLVSRVKIMAGLDIAEKRVPQDGRIQIRYRERDIDLRVSTMPTVFGEKVVIRILDKTRMIRRLDELGFTAGNLRRLRRILRHPYGMLLITGPTGSGKTSTLYAVLNELNAPELNLITIEDPVEYLMTGVNQIPVRPRAGLTFSRGLRSILRQDPDIVMVGEIRDAETAEIAIRAAGTGHLVFSTLHTNDAVGALSRLVDMGVERFLVASAVLGVVAQRLVRVICPRCRETYAVPVGAPERFFMGLGAEEPVTVYRGKGCAHCSHQGYRGRTAIAEVLPLGTEMRRLVSDGADAGALQRQAAQEGMVSIRDDGLEKARRGITTVGEVMRVAYAE